MLLSYFLDLRADGNLVKGNLGSYKEIQSGAGASRKSMPSEGRFARAFAFSLHEASLQPYTTNLSSKTIPVLARQIAAFGPEGTPRVIASLLSGSSLCYHLFIEVHKRASQQ